MKVFARSLLAASLLLVGAGSTLPHRARSSDGPVFHKYAVAADHVDASAAGAQLLASGGTAADAAAATMLALGVASPTGSGLGGGGFALYYRAKDKTLTFLDFRETAPQAASTELFKARAGETPEATSARSRSGGLAVGVPGEPLGIAELVKRFGNKPLSEVVKPAEALARDGYSLSAHTQKLASMPGTPFSKDPLFAAVFTPAALAEKRVKNPALADTLRRFGQEGEKLFYTGALAKQIVAASKAQGGILTAADLARYRVRVREPLHAQRLGYDWVTAPLPSAGGYTMVSSLGLLERWLPTAAHWKSDERLHALVESWKGQYLDRQAYFGDPDHVKVPLAELTAESRFEARAARYHPALALASEAYAQPLAKPPALAKTPDNRGTSHLCVVDQEGNVASVTTTVNLTFGAGIGVGGFWLNDEMDDFAREVGKKNAFGLVGGAPNLPGPGKRPISSMSPTIVLQDGAPVLCIGGSGGSRIPTAVEQVALYVLKDGLHPREAVVAPRVHHQADPEQVEGRDLPASALADLTLRGHKVTPTQWSAQVQAIRIVAAGAASSGAGSAAVERRLEAASDPGKGGEPRGE
ncbi:MAG: Gamma-glutamyltranspeptidase [Myxococcaceae bacterium]|nr:Gamma-glutamyltranspeptidase [Myxococcaceae bacterium]